MSQAMTGGGDYDRHSEAQVRDARSQADLVAAAADRVPLGERGPVVLADYGCAQGRASVDLLRVAVEHVRGRDAEVPVLVIHNDVLANDWASLFDTIRADDSYLAVPGGPITPMAAAASFYEPVVPPGLVDLGTSFAALQWLSQPGPSGTGSALYGDQLDGRARAVLAEQAHRDWTRFLVRRADELAPRGRLVLDMMGADEDGNWAAHDAWAALRGVVEELVDQGKLEADRLDDFVMPLWERSIEEVRRPFEEDVGSRLRLEQVVRHESALPAQTQYREDGDAETFAAEITGFVRAFSEPTLRAALDPGGTVMDELYVRLRRRLVVQADTFDFTVHLLTVVVATA